MKPSRKQYIVLDKAKEGGSFTKADAMSWPGIDYRSNRPRTTLSAYHSQS